MNYIYQVGLTRSRKKSLQNTTHKYEKLISRQYYLCRQNPHKKVNHKCPMTKLDGGDQVSDREREMYEYQRVKALPSCARLREE